jgi:hypothetical protein
MCEELENIKIALLGKQYGQTIKDCTANLRRNSLSGKEKKKALELRGRAFLGMKDKDKALADLLAAYAVDEENDEELLAALAEAFEINGKTACAAECYEQAAEKSLANRKEWQLRAKKLRKSGGSSEDRAIAEVFLKKQDILISERHSTIAEHIKYSENSIKNRLYLPRRVATQSRLYILRGDSSFTPILHGRGGGYFIAHAGKGCVVDPGYGFIQSFLREGFGFGDIHAIIVTHAHDDHVSDLPAICSILKKANLKAKVDLYLDETAYAAFASHYLLALEQFNVKKLIKPGASALEIFSDGKKKLMLDVYKTRHKVPVLKPGKRNRRMEIKFKHAVGLGFTFQFSKDKSQYLLYSGDTGWDEKIKNQYERKKGKVDVALLHISSIKPCEGNWLAPGGEKNKKTLYPQHLGLLGVVRFIDNIKPSVVLLGERGAELQKVWKYLPGIIADASNYPRSDVHATEIGTEVILNGEKIEVI